MIIWTITRRKFTKNHIHVSFDYKALYIRLAVRFGGNWQRKTVDKVLSLIHGCRSTKGTVSLVCAQSREPLPPAEARRGLSSSRIAASGVLEQHASRALHHLGEEHWRPGAEATVVLVLVLVVLAVEITALKRNLFSFHRNT